LGEYVLTRQHIAGIACAAALFLGSCSSATVQNETLDAGETQAFDAPYSRVTAAAVDGLRAAKLDVTGTKEETDTFVVTFVRPISAWQWGGVGRLVVGRKASPPIPVTINYDRRLVGPGSGQERYARLIFTKMGEILHTTGVSSAPIAAR
jgi:hypothetical protein